MAILCAIGLRRGPELAQRLAQLMPPPQELLLVYVIDVGPRQSWEQRTRPFRPGPRGHPERQAHMAEAETRSGEDILVEARVAALQMGFTATVRLARGNPERMLAQLAQETDATLLVVFAREAPEGRPLIGPPSVGHTARFVLDHAPCPVLLLRG
jgi:nucleotide-binding universal stress UspA family protein